MCKKSKSNLKRKYNQELDEIFQQYLWDCNFFTSSIMIHRNDNGGKNYKSFDECCNIANKHAKESYLRRKKEIDDNFIKLGITTEELAKWTSQRKKKNN